MRSIASLLLTTLFTLAVTSAGCSQPVASKEPTEAGSSLTANAPQDRTGGVHVEVPQGASALDRLPDVIDRTLPGVVGISTRRTMTAPRSQFRSPFGPFFGLPPQPQERMLEGMGSGVIVSADGVILTNNHVVADADEIAVRLYDDGEYTAEIVGTDPKSDVAVVKLKDPPSDLQPVPFGDSDGLRLGQPVVAIGNPFGLSSTVTLGIVSATGRANVGIVDYEDFIQTDAAINPGNSGGALVNMNGELIGINTAIVSRTGGYQGIGFAIPSNMARSIQESLVADGKVTRGWLGVMIQTMTPELADAFEIERNVRGVVISDVQDDSPAADAGLRRGDIIVAINDRKIDDASAVRNFVALQAPDTHVGVEILRNGKSMVVDVKLGELGRGGPADAPVEVGIDGLTLDRVDPEFRARFNLPDRLEGVGVAAVEPGSFAARSGLRPGDVIVEFNRRRVTSVAEFEKIYASAKNRLLFLVYRDGATLFLAVPKP